MKFLALFLTYLICLNSYAAPMGVSGQNQTNKYPSVIKVPNNLATDIGSSTSLLETGNNNILVNPSFEHSTAATGWTSSTVTPAASTTTVIHGKKALCFTASSQAFTLSQDSTLYASQFADGVQGLAFIRLKTNHTGAITVCSNNAGTASTTNCVTAQASNTWGLYKLPFILGATSNGLTVSAASGSGTTCVDDGFVGAVDLKQDVDQSRLVGESYFPGTTSCTWTRASATVGAFTAVAACPGPTMAIPAQMGDWQTTDTDLPRQVINNLPRGRYRATFYVNSYTGTGTSNGISINDGTTTCEPVMGEPSSTLNSTTTVSCTFDYTSSGNRTFELYGATTAAANLNIVNNVTSPRTSLKFQLEYFGSGSVYSTTNANYSRTAWTPTFTGFGSVTVSDCYHSRDGQYLDIDCKFTAGTPTAVEARVSLPTVNGIQLTSGSSTGIRIAGDLTTTESSAAPVNYLLIEPSTSYFTFGTRPASASTVFTKLNGSAYVSAGAVIAFTARIPISQWDNSNAIIGQFNEMLTTPGVATPVDCSFRVSATGTVSNTFGTCVPASCSVASAVYTCAHTGKFASTPNCTVQAVKNGVIVGSVYDDSASTKDQLVYVTLGSSGTANAGPVIVNCHGQAP